MPLKLITLNIEGDKHFDTVFPFLQQQAADVVCLQEVFEADLELIKQTLGGTIYFAPMNSMQGTLPQHAARGSWGIAIWLKDILVNCQIETYYYVGDATRARAVDDPYNSSRAVLVATIEHETQQYVIANTHFTWTPDGKASEQQRIDLQELLKKLEPYPELILCGDFNAPRGEEIFSQLCEHFTDNLPADVVSTIDPKLHRTHGKFDLVVDTIFSTPGYLVEDVQAFEGISDHKAIVGTIVATN